MARRDPVTIAWVVGVVLAVVAYAVGPGNFLFQVSDWFHVAMWRIGETIGDFSLAMANAVRALAIGLYATFVLLAVTVWRRGGRAKWALFWVTVLFLLLIGGVEMATESNARWTMALILSLLGAMAMTQRLRSSALVAR